MSIDMSFSTHKATLMDNGTIMCDGKELTVPEHTYQRIKVYLQNIKSLMRRKYILYGYPDVDKVCHCIIERVTLGLDEEGDYHYEVILLDSKTGKSLGHFSGRLIKEQNSLVFDTEDNNKLIGEIQVLERSMQSLKQQITELENKKSVIWESLERSAYDISYFTEAEK